MMRPRTYTRAWHTSVNNVRKAGQKGYRAGRRRKKPIRALSNGVARVHKMLRPSARPPPLERGECFPQEKIIFYSPAEKSLSSSLSRFFRTLFLLLLLFSFSLFLSSSFNLATGKRAEKHASVNNEKEKEGGRGERS